MKPILEVQGVSKKFRISHEDGPYLVLRDKLTDIFKSGKTYREDFWALRDVSFEVSPGDSIGIIGKNGAGKSTLLKILSRITPPTEGRIISRGRMASLLEVGTGFHPELTGRENVFLNGSILGMKKKEIEARFDEIVDFAATEKFLDTPLKHYSSGMQLRLAFAVAAFLEPEILIIDEVLAVGDTEFQKKCIGKMEDVSRSGRTILFVSHNMSAIARLCSKTVLLKDGRVQALGQSDVVIEKYMGLIQSRAGDHVGVVYFNSDNSSKLVHKIEVLCDGRNSNIAYMGCQMTIKVHFKASFELEYPIVGVILNDSQNLPIIGVNNKHYTGNVVPKPVSEGCISMQIPYLTLFEDIYSLDIHFGNSFRDLEVLRSCLQITVEPMKFTASGDMPDKKLNRVFIKDISWSFEPPEK